jgi:hypothetical protein
MRTSPSFISSSLQTKTCAIPRSLPDSLLTALHVL